MRETRDKADLPESGALGTPLADRHSTESEQRLSRREFGARLVRAGWWSLAAAGAVSLWSTVRFFIPRAVYTPPTKFLAGRPLDYTPGEVSVRFQDEHKVWIVRSGAGIFALVAKCSHLGCRPNWFPEEHCFKCPCHGSNFDGEGKVIAGPAPRPLRRAAVSLTQDGRILVNRAQQAEYDEATTLAGFLIPADQFEPVEAAA